MSLRYYVMEEHCLFITMVEENKAKYNSIITFLQRIKLTIIVTVKVIVSVHKEILNVVIFIKITINTKVSSVV